MSSPNVFISQASDWSGIPLLRTCFTQIRFPLRTCGNDSKFLKNCEVIMRKSITRRTFIKISSSAAIAGALYLNTPIKIFADENNKSKVVLIRDEDILNAQESG